MTLPAASAKLEIRLLGSPVVAAAGRSISITRRKVRALLYRLASAPDPVSREHLSFLFWPDARESAARRNLTGLLSHLRRALPDPDLVVVQDDHVALDPTLVWSDVLALEGLNASPLHRTELEVCERVTDLYRGSFLTGVSLADSPEYELWITLERTSWEQRYLAAIATLVDHDTATGKHRAAIDLAHRYLEVDDLAENMHRRLIELYAFAGDRHGAVRQYERCAEILERELGVEPLPETQAAYRAALEGSLAAVAAPPADPEGVAVPTLDVPLVGRDSLLSELDSAFSQAQVGQGAVVLLSGEPGIGKTRLMKEFAYRLEGRAHLMQGAGHPDSQLTPYQPLVDALRPALAANPSWLDMAGCFFDEIALLMPELRRHVETRVPDKVRSGRATGVQARTGLFEALARLVFGIASGPLPLVLFLDDLHWADGTTLDWLGFLGRRLGGERLLIVGSYNSEDLEQVAALHRTLPQALVDPEFTLRRLAPRDILQILDHLGELLPPDGDLADLLCQSTGGNPLYLVETLYALTEATCDVDDLAGMVDFCLPDAVREAVDGRLSRLDPVTRQVLESGAVLGPAFTLEQVQQTSGRSEMETMDALDELVARQMLYEGSSRHGFRNEVIRAATYRSLGRGRRRLLHRRAGEALEQTRTRDLPSLARHFEYGSEPGRAALYSLEAGRAAKAVFGHQEALKRFDRALVLLDQQLAMEQGAELIDANQRLRIEVLHERGWAYRLLGKMDAYNDDLEQEARLAEALGDAGTLAHLRFRQAYAHRWSCRYGQARAAAKEGLALGREVGDSTLEAGCLREIGESTRETGEHSTAQEALNAALTIAASLHDTVLQLHVMSNLSTLYWRQGEYKRSLALAQEALSLADDSGLALERRLSLGDIGAAAAALGDLESAQAALEESLQIARLTSDRTQEIFCMHHLGLLSIRRQRPEAALDAFRSGLKLAKDIGSCAEQSALQLGISEAHHLAGRSADAQQYAQRALQLAQSTGRAYDEHLARENLENLRNS